MKQVNGGFKIWILAQRPLFLHVSTTEHQKALIPLLPVLWIFKEAAFHFPEKLITYLYQIMQFSSFN